MNSPARTVAGLAMPRVRPGERPSWVATGIGPDTQAGWERAAAKADIGVDAWVAVLVEAALVREDLGDDAFAAVVAAAERQVRLSWLAPAPDLRAWAAGGVGQGATPHELPEVVLPARVANRLQPARRARQIIDATAMPFPAARVIDVAAAREGMTLEAWAFRAAARNAVTG